MGLAFAEMLNGATGHSMRGNANGPNQGKSRGDEKKP